MRAAAVDRAEVGEMAGLFQHGRYAELEALCERMSRLEPAVGMHWKVLGVALRLQGKDALAAMQKAAHLLPDDAEAHGNLGNALRAAGRAAEAVISHRRALTIDPSRAESHNDLGSALQDLGLLEEALASFRRATACNPDFALAHSNAGSVLTSLGRPAEAANSSRQALRCNPAFTPAILQLAEIEASLGRFVQAEQLIGRALALDPDMPEAWAGIVRLRKMTREDLHWLSQAQRVAQLDLPPRREVHLRYALGKYFDDVGDHESAFGHYRRANELNRALRGGFDRAAFTRGVNLILETFDQRRLTAAVRDADSSERPVFVIGMPRSGTTLAEQILASHSSVHGAGELPFWGRAAQRQAQCRQSVLTDEDMRGMARAYLRLLRELTGDALRVVDKMPANFLYVGLLHLALPGARIIHMQRDMLDTCLSIYFQNFDATHPYANDLGDLAHYHAEYARIMDHWRQVIPAHAMLEVPYEALVGDPEAWSRRMVAFVGLPWEAQCLDFPHGERTVSTFSKWQARQRITTASVGRWRHYERYLGPLADLAPARPSAVA